MVIFFVAGHDTTSNALACALYHIARDPILQDQLHAEITSHLGPSTNETSIPTLEETKSMDLLNSVIKESLRLYPSVNLLPQRSVSRDTPIGPYTIPPGTEVSLNIYSIHHNPKYWDDPDEFHPERFKGAAADIDAQGGIVGGKKDPLAWVPFSYGTRSCIGMNFSLIEQRVVLSMLVHKFQFSLPEGSKHKDGLKFSARGITSPDELKIEFSPRC